METDIKVKRLFHLIEKHRIFAGLNKKELAARADITPQYYSELLEGKKIPSIGIVFRLLDAVQCDLMPIFRENIL